MVNLKIGAIAVSIFIVLVVISKLMEPEGTSNCSEYYHYWWGKRDYSGVISYKGRIKGKYRNKPFLYIKVKSDMAFGSVGLRLYSTDSTFGFYSKIEIGDSIYKPNGSIVLKVYKVNGDTFSYDMRDDCCVTDGSGCK